MHQITRFWPQNWKISLPWEGGHPPPPSQTLPPLGHFAPSGLVAPLPRICHFSTRCPPPPPPPNALTHGTPLALYYTTLYWQDTKIKINLWICERAYIFWHFHNLKLLFASSFCWYFRYFLWEIFIFRSQITSAYIIHNHCIFLISLYGMMLYINDSIPTKHLLVHWENVCNIWERAEQVSLENFSHFHILKLLFPSIFCW